MSEEENVVANVRGVVVLEIVDADVSSWNEHGRGSFLGFLFIRVSNFLALNRFFMETLLRNLFCPLFNNTSHAFFFSDLRIR